MRQPDEGLGPPGPPPADQGILDAVVALARGLRESGLAVSVEQELGLCRALAEVDVRRREDVYWAARALFLRSPEEIEAFDQVFARFWIGLTPVPGEYIAEHGEGDPRMPSPQHGGQSLPQFRREEISGEPVLEGDPSTAAQEIPSSPQEDESEGERRGVLAAYSAEEVIAESEPLDFEQDELTTVRRLAHELRAVVPERRSRRMRPTRREGQLDVGRTLRRALQTDGEVVRPAYVGHSRKPRRLLLLCDVSGSMERYSRVLLASLQAAVVAGIKAEAFAFATRLTRLTATLAGLDLSRALEQAREQVVDWSGGTRIGESLGDFNQNYARLGLARGAIAIVVSDGWDRGDPDVLVRETERLRLQARRLVWVNPRPVDIGNQPLAMGMRAVLPHVDDFVPGHDPRLQAGLVRLIAGLGSDRPQRPQRPFEPARA